MSNQEVVEAFSELAPRYEQTMERELRTLWGLSYLELIGRLVEIAPINERALLLDVATGTAQIPLALARRVDNHSAIVGLDLTPAMLRRGQAHIAASGVSPAIRLVCSSATDMPLGTGLFDVVLCAFAMHHMDVPQVLLQIHRVLKDDGHLVLCDVNAPVYWQNRMTRALLALAALLYYTWNHSPARAQAEISAIPNIRTAAQWRTTLAQCGFARLEVVYTFRGRYPWYPNAFALIATKNGAGDAP
jgi:ubiquinone/menaquinone biosynthesis C-methylase UbiE